MADRKISELPEFPHYEFIQNADIFYVVASGLASETRDATNYRVSFTGLASDISRHFGGGSSIFDANGEKIRIGSIEPGDDRAVEIEDDLYIVGDLYSNSNAFFDQNVSITGDISASGDADFIDLYVHGNAFVKHDTTLTGSLTTYGTSNFFGPLISSGPTFDVLGISTFSGPANTFNSPFNVFNGNVDVNGDADFTQNVSITGDINASGDADFQDLYVHGNAFVKHDTTISGDLTVLGNTTTIDTERLVAEDSNIEIGDHKELTTEETANFGGITLKTHNNDSFASVVIEGVTITSRAAGTVGNNISITMRTFPGSSDEDSLVITDPGDGSTDLEVKFSIVSSLSEKTQSDFAELLNCNAGHLVRAIPSNPNSPLTTTCYRKFLENGQGQDGFNKNIEWVKSCDAWTMNTNLHVYGSGVFSEGINFANENIAAGVKIALSDDVDNYGGLMMESGYLKIENWASTGGEAALFLSDVNLKSDREKIDSPTEILNQINGIYFTWNESAHASLTGKKDIGVIAQEVQAVLPEIVAENTAGNLAVAYHKMIPVLIESVKELSQENKSLKSRIERLESEE